MAGLPPIDGEYIFKNAKAVGAKLHVTWEEASSEEGVRGRQVTKIYSIACTQGVEKIKPSDFVNKSDAEKLAAKVEKLLSREIFNSTEEGEALFASPRSRIVLGNSSIQVWNKPEGGRPTEFKFKKDKDIEKLMKLSQSYMGKGRLIELQSFGPDIIEDIPIEEE